MLIPSIDLSRGRIVQLVQGERLALESDDVEGWIERFRGFASVQLIDLDAARTVGRGFTPRHSPNDALVARIAAALPCRVGGGIRDETRARQVLDLGATAVIMGSALFRPGGADVEAAARVAHAIGAERLIAAVDSRAGQVVIHGWRTPVGITAVDAVRALEPHAGGFLYTHVDREGLMQGTDMDAIAAVRAATRKPLTAAGGITTREEIDELHALGVDAVVGMAIYTGRLGATADRR
jgi:phosphoribosylformimino-5-aminoimidazole carboxamide ribotide isomerase